MRNVWTVLATLALGSACNPNKSTETAASQAPATEAVEVAPVTTEAPAAVTPGTEAVTIDAAAEATVKTEEESKAVQGPTTGAVEAQPSTEAPAKKL